jgi:SnoaL-like protein
MREGYHIPALTPEEARLFCERWLPAWTGNNPSRLASFYTDDLFYLDPSIRGGVNGKKQFIRYLEKLLGQNPNWAWQHQEAVPLQNGFLNKWRLSAPVGDTTVVCDGVCMVQLRDGLIYRNEVYFDMTELLGAIARWNERKQRNRKIV